MWCVIRRTEPPGGTPSKAGADGGGCQVMNMGQLRRIVDILVDEKFARLSGKDGDTVERV
jgi:hypothetical protein